MAAVRNSIGVRKFRAPSAKIKQKKTLAQKKANLAWFERRKREMLANALAAGAKKPPA